MAANKYSKIIKPSLDKYKVKNTGINKAIVSDVNIRWNVKEGTTTFEDLPVIMMWIGSSLAGLMSGVQSMVGTKRFFLAQQSQGRASCKDDWEVISQYKDFREGFKAIANIAAVAGWGAWKLKKLDKIKKTAVVSIRNSWEGEFQKALGVSWGSGMLAGKMAGYFSLLFKTNCWAVQTKFVSKGNAYDEFVIKPSKRSIENEINNLLSSDEATRADMAVALRKLQIEIEERKKTEAKLKSYQEHLAKVNEELQKAIKIKADFIDMVSHELRTPLTAIRAGIDIVFDEVTGEINEEQKNLLSLANRNMDRLARLVNAVLDFQKLESGRMEFRMKINDINDVISEIYEMMGSLVKKKNLDFVIKLDKNLPKIVFDHDKVAQVLVNLIDNSLKFTESGSIEVSTSLYNGFIKVSVKDTGLGIKKEDMPKLFDRFIQLNKRSGGTGLGLAICKDIIEKHKGKIWAESEFEKGACFSFTLPIKKSGT